jgi:phage-related protein
MKTVRFIGSSLEDLRALPHQAQRDIGFALYEAQLGGKSYHAKPLKGFRGASVLEVIEDLDGDTYRAVYTVKLANAIYVLHVFQKRSKRGIATPQLDLDLIASRLKLAETQSKTG